MITVDLPDEMIKAATKLSKKRDQTLEELAIHALQDYFDIYSDRLDRIAILMSEDRSLSFEDAWEKFDEELFQKQKK